MLEQVRLGPEDRLLLYTDGLVEARAADGRQFEPDERVEACLTAATLDRALDGLVGLLLAHAGGRLNDDLALVLLAPATSPFPRARPPRGRRGWQRILTLPSPADGVGETGPMDDAGVS